MRPTPITEHSLPHIIKQLENSIGKPKAYECVIRVHDESLKGRQRALAKIWYKEIGEEVGELVGPIEAFCKWKFGLKLICFQKPVLEAMIRKMLDGRDYDEKLLIIEEYSEWFPVLRDKGGLTSELTGKYLKSIQEFYADEHDIVLSSPKEKDLLNCKEANK